MFWLKIFGSVITNKTGKCAVLPCQKYPMVSFTLTNVEMQPSRLQLHHHHFHKLIWKSTTKYEKCNRKLAITQTFSAHTFSLWHVSYLMLLHCSVIWSITGWCVGIILILHTWNLTSPPFTSKSMKLKSYSRAMLQTPSKGKFELIAGDGF